jgi:uncharacterized protein
MFHSKKGIAVVTGASTGIGAVYADRLAHQDYDLLLVARNRERLEGLRKRLAYNSGSKVNYLVADLSRRSDLTRVEEVLRGDPRIAMLVNNAGVGAVKPLLDSDAEKMTDMINLNVVALMRLTYALAPGLVKRGGGTIINIASIAGLVPEILNGVYGGTKAFVLAFSQSLHKELAAHNIRVQVVLPGATATEFWSTAGKPVEHLPSEIVMRAEHVVDASLAGLEHGEQVTIPSLPDVADWEAYEAARKKMMPRLSLSWPATRYGITSKQAA